MFVNPILKFPCVTCIKLTIFIALQHIYIEHSVYLTGLAIIEALAA
jgi:hypothetical protein